MADPMAADLEALVPSQILNAGRDPEQLAVVTFLARGYDAAQADLTDASHNRGVIHRPLSRGLESLRHNDFSRQSAVEIGDPGAAATARGLADHEESTWPNVPAQLATATATITRAATARCTTDAGKCTATPTSYSNPEPSAPEPPPLIGSTRVSTSTRRPAAGTGQDVRPTTATARSWSTTNSGSRTAGPTSITSGPSRMACTPTTCAVTERAATPSTLSPSHHERTDFAASAQPHTTRVRRTARRTIHCPETTSPTRAAGGSVAPVDAHGVASTTSSDDSADDMDKDSGGGTARRGSVVGMSDERRVGVTSRELNATRRLVTAGLRPDSARMLAAGGFDLIDVWPLDLSFFGPVPCNFTAALSRDGAS